MPPRILVLLEKLAFLLIVSPCKVTLFSLLLNSHTLSFDGNQQQPPPQRVNLLVEGVRFVVDVNSLRAHPDTMLGRMFQSNFIESAATSSYEAQLGQLLPSGTTTTCEDDDDDDELDEEDGTSSVCSGGGRVIDVEHWMAAASTSASTNSRGPTAVVPSGVVPHSAPASYRSHRGSLCGTGAGGGSRRRVRLPTHRRGRQTSPTDVCLSGAGVAANVFRVILDYYLLGKMTCPPDVSVKQLKQACEYFLIPFNHETVSCSNLRKCVFLYSDYYFFKGCL